MPAARQPCFRGLQSFGASGLGWRGSSSASSTPPGTANAVRRRHPPTVTGRGEFHPFPLSSSTVASMSSRICQIQLMAPVIVGRMRGELCRRRPGNHTDNPFQWTDSRNWSIVGPQPARARSASRSPSLLWQPSETLGWMTGRAGERSKTQLTGAWRDKKSSRALVNMSSASTFGRCPAPSITSSSGC